jgi:hypothetical protein
MRVIPFFPDFPDFPFLEFPDYTADDRRPQTDGLSISASADDHTPKTDDITNYHSNQNKKRRGQTVEYRLALECMERNIPVARPYLDCEKYDAVVLPHPSPWDGNNGMGTASSHAIVDTNGRGTASSRAVLARKKNGASAPALETRNPKRETALKLETRAYWKGRELRIKIARVQVRSAHTLHHGAYDIPLTSGANSEPYRLGDFEILAAYVAPERAWYLIPAEALVRRQVPCGDGHAAHPSRAKRGSLPADDRRSPTDDPMQTSISLYPHKKGSRGRFEKFRERWDLLM